MSIESPIERADNFFAGDDKVLRFTVVDASAVAVDISTWSVEWLLRRGLGQAALLTKTTSDGITLTTPVSGILDVVIADTDTAALKPDIYEYVLRRADDGFEQVLAYGACHLLPAMGVANA